MRKLARRPRKTLDVIRDATVPVQARRRTVTGGLWVYVRDNAPFGSRSPPASLFYYSPDHSAEQLIKHLTRHGGILQADPYAGLNGLYAAGCQPAPLVEVVCCAHGRCKLFELAELSKASLAVEAVRRTDAILDRERDLNGLPPEQRRLEEQDTVAPVGGRSRALDA